MKVLPIKIYNSKLKIKCLQLNTDLKFMEIFYLHHVKSININYIVIFILKTMEDHDLFVVSVEKCFLGQRFPKDDRVY
jgi:hypothetical protein